jgi:hypothetical protein
LSSLPNILIILRVYHFMELHRQKMSILKILSVKEAGRIMTWAGIANGTKKRRGNFLRHGQKSTGLAKLPGMWYFHITDDGPEFIQYTLYSDMMTERRVLWRTANL